ncbi:ankyrin repeat domain-containing protein [Hymenobacter sp. UYCo722]|uniref:ankyrin repeat domain-containing protein n=1 Tax=Hymenobacter sp. UYCo722 TaxID=3156335 RepID=UPI0033967073
MKRVLLFVATLFCFATAAQAQTPTPAQSLKKAVLKSDLPTAEALLKAGTDPNAAIEIVPGSATTYLITAATNNSLEVVKLLLQAKAQVNQVDAFKTTALMTAVSKGNAAMVALLLASGADARAKDDDGKDALALARETGNAAIIALLEAKLK